jgi:hypothetical protein
LKEASRELTVGTTEVFECFLKFKSGVTSEEDAEHTGHPSTSKTDEM